MVFDIRNLHELGHHWSHSTHAIVIPETNVDHILLWVSLIQTLCPYCDWTATNGFCKDLYQHEELQHGSNEKCQIKGVVRLARSGDCNHEHALLAGSLRAQGGDDLA